MRKIFMLVLTVLLQVDTAMPQDGYRPLLEEGKILKYNYNNGRKQYMKSLKISNDTIIGYTYKKIIDISSQSIEMMLREEGKKVYCRYPSHDAEILLYDFGKDTGDIISKEEKYGETVILKVMSVKNIMVGSNSFRGMEIHEYHVPEGTPEEKLSEYCHEKGWWVEGIGSYKGLDSPIDYPGNYFTFYECQIGNETFGQTELFGFVTYIKPLKSSKIDSKKNVIFNLFGHIVQLPQKEIYIQNGKKKLSK